MVGQTLDDMQYSQPRHALFEPLIQLDHPARINRSVIQLEATTEHCSIH